MRSWMLVIMMWNPGGVSSTVAPGLYADEGSCNMAAGSLNSQIEVMQGFNSGAVCIPGPSIIMSPLPKK